jgi:hypothetical protein
MKDRPAAFVGGQDADGDDLVGPIYGNEHGIWRHGLRITRPRDHFSTAHAPYEDDMASPDLTLCRELLDTLRNDIAVFEP